MRLVLKRNKSYKAELRILIVMFIKCFHKSTIYLLSKIYLAYKFAIIVVTDLNRMLLFSLSFM